jgi:hypothetical protein
MVCDLISVDHARGERCMHFDCLLAFLIFLNHVDRLLHIAQDDIAMAVISLQTRSAC